MSLTKKEKKVLRISLEDKNLSDTQTPYSSYIPNQQIDKIKKLEEIN